jgi:hypothetical protein
VRWVATLVTAVCLLAASGVRAEDARTGDRAAHLAAVATSHLAARTQHRLAPFALPAGAVATPPPTARALGIAAVAHAAPAPTLAVPRSRGPPLG